MPGRLDRLLERERQDGVRRHLDQRPVPVGEDRPHRLVEADQLAQRRGPVGGVELGALDPRPRRRGVHRHPGLPWRDARDVPRDARVHLAQRRGVDRRADADRLSGDPAIGQHAAQLFERGVGPGDHRDTRPVERGDDDAVGQQLTQLLGRRTDRDHVAAGHGGLPLAPARDHEGRVVERERLGHHRRRQLAEAVAEHRRGLDTVGPPQDGEGVRDGEDARLDDGSAAQLGRLRRPPEHVGDPPASHPRAGVVRRRERRAVGGVVDQVESPSPATAGPKGGKTNTVRASPSAVPRMTSPASCPARAPAARRATRRVPRRRRPRARARDRQRASDAASDGSAHGLVLHPLGQARRAATQVLRRPRRKGKQEVPRSPVHPGAEHHYRRHHGPSLPPARAHSHPMAHPSSRRLRPANRTGVPERSEYSD
jgi:hypothetical protein